MNDSPQTIPTVRPLWQRLLPLALPVAIAVALIFSGAYGELQLAGLSRRFAELQAWVQANPLLAFAVQFALLATITASGLPGGSALVLCGGALLGPIGNGVVSISGTVLGASILFAGARHASHVEGRVRTVAERLRGGFARAPWSYAFFVRLVPLFPFGVTTLALGFLHLNWRIFLISSWLGGLPAMLLWGWLGSGLGDALARGEAPDLSLISNPQIAVPLLLFASLALIPLVIQKLRSGKR